MTAKSGLLLYGANGYTGKLILEVALREGFGPSWRAAARMPSSRSRRRTALRASASRSTTPASSRALLEPFSALLLAAGPFSKTSAPALEACLRSKTAYLDITGEVDVFEVGLRARRRREEAGIAVLPGHRLRRRAVGLPRESPVGSAARSRRPSTLAFRGFKSSAGTMKTMLEGIPKGGLARVDGKLVRVPGGVEDDGGPVRRQAAARDDDPVGRPLDGVPLDRDPEHRGLHGGPALGGLERAADAALRAAPRPSVRPVVPEGGASRSASRARRRRSASASARSCGGASRTAERSSTGTLETLEGYALTAETRRRDREARPRGRRRAGRPHAVAGLRVALHRDDSGRH